MSRILFFDPFFFPCARGESSEKGVFGTIDVNRVTQGQIVFRKLILNRSDISQNYALAFDVSSPINAEDVYEFRVYSTGLADMLVREIILIKSSAG